MVRVGGTCPVSDVSLRQAGLVEAKRAPPLAVDNLSTHSLFSNLNRSPSAKHRVDLRPVLPPTCLVRARANLYHLISGLSIVFCVGARKGCSFAILGPFPYATAASMQPHYSAFVSPTTILQSRIGIFFSNGFFPSSFCNRGSVLIWLQEHKRRMVEAKRRDHRVLGKKLDLFSLQEDAGGGLVREK